MLYRGFQPVIGIEIHVQLLTQSKLFVADSTAFDSGDNVNTSPVSVGMPGSLPVLNKKAIEYGIKAGLAFGCKVKKKSIFSRKNYFYPDLPKGYQISQFDQPICELGSIDFLVDGKMKTVSITRAHLEEDAGKSSHHGEYTLINYNRAGIPLLEIVSGPDMHTSREASEYCKAIRNIVRYLEICDGNLEEGSLRCDINISIKRPNDTQLGTKVEIKNINSFRFIEKAIEFEMDRQIDALERGKKIIQETRLWDPDKNRTVSMRTKEDAQDYRYFPDPDLLPLILSDELIQKIKESIPELPAKRYQRFLEDHGLSEAESESLVSEKDIADYFEEVGQASGNYKASANWVLSELMRELKSDRVDIRDCPVKAQNLARLIVLIDQKVISGKIAKTVFSEMWRTRETPESIIRQRGLVQITDPAAIENVVAQVILSHPQQLQEYRSGKLKVFGFFVGAIMKATQGQANPDLVNEILLRKLKE